MNPDYSLWNYALISLNNPLKELVTSVFKKKPVAGARSESSGSKKTMAFNLRNQWHYPVSPLAANGSRLCLSNFYGEFTVPIISISVRYRVKTAEYGPTKGIKRMVPKPQSEKQKNATN